MKLVLIILLLLSQFSLGNQSNYVFGWTQLNDPDLMTPTGGTSSGPNVSLDNTQSPFWQKI